MEKTELVTITDLNDIATIAIENPKMEYKGKRAGNFYRIYGYSGKRFALPEEHPFNRAFDNSKDLTVVKLQGKKYDRAITKVDDQGVEVKSTEQREAWELAGFTTRGETLNNRLFDVKLKAIDKLADVSSMDETTLSTVLATTL